MDYRRFGNKIIARIDKGEEILEKIKEISLNSPIGRSIYLKSINDNDICYYVNDKKIGIKIIKRIYEN